MVVSPVTSNNFFSASVASCAVLQFVQILLQVFELLYLLRMQLPGMVLPHIYKSHNCQGASFVWRVDITRCPVIAALTAISAVSSSLISPTIIMSGSCLSIDLSPVENNKPAFVFTWTWFIPSILYSTGSSTVIMFCSLC